jgi:cyclopropane-fatty-acyl-phospholipid synthase
MHMTGLGRLDSAFDDDHQIVGRVGGFSLHWKFASDLIRHGLLYALANDRIHSPKPLAPLENWKYWTDPKPLWLESLIRAYPPKWMRKAYVDTMLKRDQASGIQAHYDVSN